MKKGKIVASVLVIGACVAYLFSQSFGDQMVYTKYVHELMRDRRRLVGRTVRLEGMVDEGSVDNPPGSLDYRFRLSTGGATVPVHFTGIVPDAFREGVGVVAQGRLTSRGVFEADEVIAKCPSKYEMEAQSGGAAPVTRARGRPGRT